MSPDFNEKLHLRGPGGRFRLMPDLLRKHPEKYGVKEYNGSSVAHHHKKRGEVVVQDKTAPDRFFVMSREQFSSLRGGEGGREFGIVPEGVETIAPAHHRPGKDAAKDGPSLPEGAFTVSDHELAQHKDELDAAEAALADAKRRLDQSHADLEAADRPGNDTQITLINDRIRRQSAAEKVFREHRDAAKAEYLQAQREHAKANTPEPTHADELKAPSKGQELAARPDPAISTHRLNSPLQMQLDRDDRDGVYSLPAGAELDLIERDGHDVRVEYYDDSGEGQVEGYISSYDFDANTTRTTGYEGHDDEDLAAAQATNEALLAAEEAKGKQADPGKLARLSEYIAAIKSEMRRREDKRYRDEHGIMGAAELTTIPRVPLAQVGTWKGLTGEFTLTEEHLDAAVEASKDEGFPGIRLKVGHTDPRFDGQPAFGRIENLVHDDGVLYGDYIGVPTTRDQLETYFPSRSIEGGYNRVSAATGTKYAFAVSAVALLGAHAPAIDTLDDLHRVLEQGIDVAAGSAEQVFGVFTPTVGSTGHNDEEGTVDLKAMATKLGLSEDATEDQINAKLDELLTAGNGGEGNEGDDKGGAPEGTVLVDEDQLKELREKAELGEQARLQQLETAREQALSEAVAAGKFPASRVDHYRAMWKADEAGAREVLAGLAPNTVPVVELGQQPDVAAGKGGDDGDRGYGHWLPEVARNSNQSKEG